MTDAIHAPEGETDSLMARIMRSSVATILGFGAQQAIRFGSNLILAHLLFPEAFGTMAVVTVLIVGLSMVSDLGIQPAIQSSKRGDEEDFLNTAWTLNLFRAFLLFLIACALAWPMSIFYDEEILLYIVPVSAISILITALEPTRAETASRHMLLGRLTVYELAAQIVSTVLLLALAFNMHSVWALVWGNVIGAVVHAVLSYVILPGIVNRPRYCRESAKELVTYGRWIFFSTFFGFIVLQADKIILGRFLTLEDLGLYNIGFFLASFPLMLGQQLTQRLAIPIYRASPPSESRENFARLSRMRYMLSGFLVAAVTPLALGGIYIVGFLYDVRYEASGGVLMLVALALLPQMIFLTYDQVTLGSGDSRGFFVLNAVRAVVLVALMTYFVWQMGIPGAPVATLLTTLLTYPLQVKLARKYGAWDPLHDAIMACVAMILALVVMWSHGDTLFHLFVN